MNVDQTDSHADKLISIGLVTDLHYSSRTYGNRYCSQSVTKLQEAVKTFLSRNPDVVINVGDSIDTGESLSDELDFLGEVQSELDRLPCDAYTVIGNHDVESMTKEQFLKGAGITGTSAHYSFDCCGVHIIVLDSNYRSDGSPFAAGNFSWDDAWIGSEQRQWLQSDLEGHSHLPALVFCHGSLDYREYQGAMDPHVVKDADKVRTIIESAGSVHAVIQGHYHPGTATTIKGIPYITLRAMVEGSGQNAYSILTLFGDGALTLEGFEHQTSMTIAPHRQT